MPHNFSFEFPSPEACWGYALRTIDSYGVHVKDEDGYLVKEVPNLMLTVQHPLVGWPIPGSGWDFPALKDYAAQFLSGENPGFEYTYGERLRRYPEVLHNGEIDQIVHCIKKLRCPSTRRAVAITWVPDWDTKSEDVPCLIVLEFFVRKGKLHLTAFFRSHDIKRAWPANVYGLGQLMEYMVNGSSIEVGSLTTISASAHVYMD